MFFRPGGLGDGEIDEVGCWGQRKFGGECSGHMDNMKNNAVTGAKDQTEDVLCQ